MLYRWLVVLISLLVFGHGAASADDLEQLSQSQLRAFSPKANDSIIAAILDNKAALRAAGVTTSQRISYLLAEFALETGGLRRIDENLNYSADRLFKVFPKSIKTKDKAADLAGHPREIANYIYGNKLGNCGRNTDDGWNYRGSGLIQITGRINFRRSARVSQLPFEANPELARQPGEGLRAALAYWTLTALNSVADADNPRQMRILVNGPSAVGYQESLLWLARARSTFGRPAGSKESSVDVLATLSAILAQRGYLTPDEKFSPDHFSEALRSFQRDEHVVPDTGEYDIETLYALTDLNNVKTERDDDETESGDPACANRPVTLNLTSLKQSYFVVPSSALAHTESAPDPSALQGSGELSESFSIDSGMLERLNAAGPLIPGYWSPKTGERDRSFVPYSVFDPDKRQVVAPTTEYPARTTVQISFHNPSDDYVYNCSGSMISADTVLTAAHCTMENGPAGRKFDRIVVFPGRNGPTEPFGHCAASDVFVLSGWLQALEPDMARLYDLAAIKLDCKVGTRTGWLNLAVSPDSAVGEETVVRGYPCDKTPIGHMWASRDAIRGVEEHRIFYRNDTWGCMSGSSVINKDGAIVAVHTTGVYDQGLSKDNNSGTRLSKSIIEDLESWAH